MVLPFTLPVIFSDYKIKDLFLKCLKLLKGFSFLMGYSKNICARQHLYSHILASLSPHSAIAFPSMAPCFCLLRPEFPGLPHLHSQLTPPVYPTSHLHPHPTVLPITVNAITRLLAEHCVSTGQSPGLFFIQNLTRAE